MFLEKCGKFFFLKVRPVFFFALAVTPLLIAAFFLSQEAGKLQSLKERFQSSARKERLAMERKERKERFFKRYSKVNPYFLDQMIESFPLLRIEKEKLISLLNHPAFPESKEFQERLFFIEENRFTFAEEKIETSKVMKEVQENQRHPIQMDEVDLKEILALLEDVPVDGNLPNNHSPQILIKDFRLKKRKTPLHTEVFEVEMDLITREFFLP